MLPKLSFHIGNSYINARAIADHICIALMRYDHNVPQSTYMATVKLSIRSMLSGNVPSIDNIKDTTFAYYTIRVYRIRGNHGSIISPISSKFFSKCVMSDELLEKLDEINGE